MEPKHNIDGASNAGQKGWAKRFALPLCIAGGIILGVGVTFLAPADWYVVDSKHDGEHQMSEHDAHQAGDHSSHDMTPKEYWACPMFCTRMDGPGECPVCGMTLEKFEDTGPMIALGDAERLALNLKTETLKNRYLAREIRTVGIFEPDETQEKVVAAWVDGRIEKLYADFTGVPVEKGWHLFDLYSPSLYAAQKELLLARDSATSGGASGEKLLRLAREKLELLGLTAEQVAYIETLDEPQLTLTIPSPSTGVVLKKSAHQGMYVKQGEPVYRIANLDRLWLMVDIHERDVSWISLGQKVDIDVDGLPGKPFEGRVGFIDPTLNAKTRTIRIRVEVDNHEGVIRPGMFATATVFAALTQAGELASPDLEGDYACPMHPLQRSESADTDCPVCGMKETLAPTSSGGERGKVLAVPRQAVLTTGRRNIVYVEDHHGEDGRRMYRFFKVELGPLAAEWHTMPDGTRHKLGDYYPVVSGLAFGMSVVTNGQFLIDSQMELTGKPSLLRPKGGESADPHAGH